MTAKQQIKNKIRKVYGDNTPNVYKGNDYDGFKQDYGWWYRPFNDQPVFLGNTLTEALENLDDIARENWNTITIGHSYIPAEAG